MKWKDILLGALMSLLVTVIGGVVVYNYTKTPELKKNAEHLTYAIQQSSSFKGGNQDVAFTAIKVKNAGGIVAKQVTIIATFSVAKIKDYSLELNSGIKEVGKEVKPHSIKLVYESLLPNEHITMNLLLSASERPVVSVRSDASSGGEESLQSEPSFKSTVFSGVLGDLLPFVGIALAILAVSYSFIRSGSFESFFSDKNNAGFLLLHHGLIDEAANVLSAAIDSGRYDVFTLSNLAVCKALKGDIDKANQLLKAANFRDSKGHGKAVVLFNEALVSFIIGQKDDGIEKLKQAIEISPGEIRRYCKQSIHLDAFRNDPVVFDIIKTS